MNIHGRNTPFPKMQPYPHTASYLFQQSPVGKLSLFLASFSLLFCKTIGCRLSFSCKYTIILHGFPSALFGSRTCKIFPDGSRLSLPISVSTLTGSGGEVFSNGGHPSNGAMLERIFPFTALVWLFSFHEIRRMVPGKTSERTFLIVRSPGQESPFSARDKLYPFRCVLTIFFFFLVIADLVRKHLVIDKAAARLFLLYLENTYFYGAVHFAHPGFLYTAVLFQSAPRSQADRSFSSLLLSFFRSVWFSRPF